MRIALVAVFACLVSLPLAGALSAQEQPSSYQLVSQSAYPGMNEVYPVQQVAYADCGSGDGGWNDCGWNGCGCDTGYGGCGCGEHNVISGSCESCGGCGCGNGGCGCGGCGDSCGGWGTCCGGGCCGPCVRVRGETLALHRWVTHDDAVFGAFNTDQLDFNHEWSFRAAVEFRVHCNCSLEVSYFGLHEWNDEVALFNPTGLALPLVNPTPGFIGPTNLRVSYDSRIHNGEVNYWMPLGCGCCSRGAFMMGARYVSLNERFRVASIAPAANGLLTTDTENHAILGQIGFSLGIPLWHCFSLRAEGKAGGGVNIAEQRTQIVPGGGGPVFNEQVDNNDGAWHSDGSVVLTYQVGCDASIYAGYYFMWLDGLALAVDQFNPAFPVVGNPNARPSFLDDNGTVLFQGPVAGFDATW